MGIYSLLDEQTWSYIIFFLGVIGLVLYSMSTFFMLVSQIGGRFVLHKKQDPIVLSDNVPGVSIIKPLMGIDPLLEVNLESHFLINYPKFELLCCVQDDQDPAINVVNMLKERYPKVDCKLFIGGREDIINPMVSNMAPAYEGAQYEYVWISTSRIKANSDIMLDLVCKLQKPNVALCHQIPFTTDQKGFAQALDKTYFGGAFARYYLAFNILGLCCTTGMSYMFKKALLDEVHGLNWYGKYLAEDFYLTHALHEKGYRLVLSAYPAQQSLQTSVMGYKDRMVRWLRLRLNMMPLVSGFLEPLTECLPLGAYGAWALYHFLGINPYIFFGSHVMGWLISDYLQLRMVQNGPLPFSKCTFLWAWILRELLVVGIFLEALIAPRTIKWGPNSFTGEDCVEFQVHGGPAVVSALLTALYKVPGCRQAEPGEFTKRAFLNGKLDLTEVEGLGDLIHAETEAQRRQALRQMEGDLSQLYSDWRGTIVKCVANIEAYIDFAEDQGIEDGVIEEVTDCVSDMRTTIQQHLDDERQGERLRVGVHVAIVGEPNVGKSSLLNRICRRPASIVTEVAGTTRDVIETAVNIGGYPVLLSDTAGIRHTDDIVEREGVHRARARAQLADLKIFMIDLDQCDLTSRNDLDIKSVIARQLINLGVSLASGVHNNLEDSIHECSRNLSHTGNDAGGSSIQWNNSIVVFNKSDLVEKSQVEQLKYQFGKICGKELTGKISGSEEQTMVEDDKLVTYPRGDVGCHGSARPDISGEIAMCSISCVTGEGLDTFLDILKAKVADMCGNPLSDHPSLTQARHRSHLTRCVEYLQQYDVMLHDDDIVLASQALRKALREIGKITGKITSEEILDVIFQDFCIGK